MCSKKKKKKGILAMFSLVGRSYNTAVKTALCFVTAFTIAMAPIAIPLVLAENDGADTGSSAPIAEVATNPGLSSEVIATEPTEETVLGDQETTNSSIDPAEEPSVEEVAGEQVAPESAEASPAGNPGGGSSTEGIVGCHPDPDPNPEVPCGENMILNGDFEIPVVSGSWDIYDSYIDGLMWTVKWMPGSDEFGGQYRPKTAPLELQRNVNDWLAYSGNQYAELDTDWDGPTGSLNGEPGSVKIYQDLITEPGKEYQATFYFSPRPGTTLEDNVLQFSWDGSVVDTISEAGGSNVNWTIHTYTLTATDTTTRVQFADLGTPNSLGVFLDNVFVAEICQEIPEPCQVGPGWASHVESYSQGNRKDGSAVNVDRSDPTAALNAPDDKFFSLGRKGFLVVSFDDYVLNVPGNDLSFHEITYGRENYPEETALIEVSQDSAQWYEIGTANNHDTDGVSYFDFDSTGLAWIKYVLITDTTDYEPHSNDADGYDIDAIDATTIICNYVEINKIGTYDSITNQIDYQIDWNIVGNGTAYGVKIVDTIPGGTEYVSADLIPTSIVGDVITWELGDLAAPASGTIHLIVALTSGTGVDPWADSVTSFMQGFRWNGTPVLPERSDPTKALGEAERNDTINFVSLGFGDEDGRGELVLGFDNYIINGVGADIEVVETSFGDPSESSYPETANVYASKDNSTWTFLKEIILDDDTIDLGSLDWARYVKLVDVSDKSNFGDSSTTDGFDIDGVQALNSLPNICLVENNVSINAFALPQGGEDIFTSDQAQVITTINELACEPAEQEEVTIVAYKIVCDVESELPNWGNGGPDIGPTTAGDWVATHRSCRFVEGWNFQWGPQGAYDPGDILTGPANAPWQTMSSTDANGMTTVSLTSEDIDGSNYLWFREELEEGYIPFSFGQNGDTNVDPVSAEMYCHVDVLNYDNYDRIDGVELGETYNCVAFNVPTEISAGSASGMKFSDDNRNHQKDTEDEGLEGWRIGVAKPVEVLWADSNGPVTGTPINSSFDSVVGREYFFRASGTFSAGDLITADAKYSVREPNTEWTDIVQNYETYGPTLLDLHLNGTAPDWGQYNSDSHGYWTSLMGDGYPFTFQIYDIFASNNNGSLKVQIYELLKDTYTDIDGNYYFDLTGIDGDVIIAEARQRGWIQTFPGNEGPNSFYVVPTNVDSTGLDFGNYNTAGGENGGGGFDLAGDQADPADPIIDDNDDDDGDGGGGGGGGGSGGGGGGGNPVIPPDDSPGDSETVLGDQQSSSDNPIGGGDVLGELVAAGTNAWTALLLAILFGLLMTGLVYRYPELLVCKKQVKK